MSGIFNGIYAFGEDIPKPVPFLRFGRYLVRLKHSGGQIRSPSLLQVDKTCLKFMANYCGGHAVGFQSSTGFKALTDIL